MAKKLYDVYFKVVNNIVIEAESEEDAEEKFSGIDNDEIKERLLQGLWEGNIEIVEVDWLEDVEE